MKNLTEGERKILAYCESKRELAKTDRHVNFLISTYLDFLETINKLRGELDSANRQTGYVREMYEAKVQAYNVSVQERAKLLSENRFLREKLKEANK